MDGIPAKAKFNFRSKLPQQSVTWEGAQKRYQKLAADAITLSILYWAVSNLFGFSGLGGSGGRQALLFARKNIVKLRDQLLKNKNVLFLGDALAEAVY